MQKLPSRERFRRMFTHREADRIPIIDSPWAGTLRRWQREGMPAGVNWTDYFDVDAVCTFGVDITPRYPVTRLSEDDRSYVETSAWGVTMRHFKAEDSTPEFIDYKVTTADAWEECKARMLTDAEDRINWDRIKRTYEISEKNNNWRQLNFWFGFDVTHSWMMGTENHLIAMYEEPELVEDMYNTYLDCCIRQFDKIYAAGYRFDAIQWPDDMGYKGTTFFSNALYRQILKPVHKRAVDWAHERGMFAHLHSCGNIMSRIDDLVEIGLDALNPLEVKAGMEPLTLKEKYGGKLTLHGGINAVLWDDKEAILEEIRRCVPVLKQNGGYIFSSDHSIPNTVTLETFRAIVEEVKRVGAY